MGMTLRFAADAIFAPIAKGKMSKAMLLYLLWTGQLRIADPTRRSLPPFGSYLQLLWTVILTQLAIDLNGTYSLVTRHPRYNMSTRRSAAT